MDARKGRPLGIFRESVNIQKEAGQPIVKNFLLPTVMVGSLTMVEAGWYNKTFI